jgi:hypothetical protein
MRARLRATSLLSAAVLVLVAVSCASRTASTTPASGPPTPSVAPAEQVWVAVLGVAEDPGDLYSDREVVLSRLGDALEGSVVVSPAGCLEGLPPSLSTAGYVLAIEQGSRAEAAILAAQVPQEPRFLGPVHVGCTD